MGKRKKERKKDENKHFHKFQFHWVQTRVTQFRVGRFIVATATFRDKRKREGGVKNWRGFPMVGNRCRKKSI